MKRLLMMSVLLTVPVSAGATGLYECAPVEQSDWLTETQLTERLTEAGWQVRRMKPDGGCWEVYGTTPDGERVEGYFDPVSGEQLLLSQRGRIVFQAEQ